MFFATLAYAGIVGGVIREIDYRQIDKVWQSADGKYPYKWSILIPSLTDRVIFFKHITNKLQIYFFQSIRFGLQRWEIFDSCDYQWDSPDYQWEFVQSKLKSRFYVICQWPYRVDCRRLSLLNPIKRLIAIKAPFTCCNMGEDVCYADGIMQMGLIKTEVAVEKICYHYCNNTAHSVRYDSLRDNPRKA
jgi:hypothetical protein